MSRRIFFIIAFILGMMSTSAASLPEELSGNISDAETGEPISGVIAVSYTHLLLRLLLAALSLSSQLQVSVFARKTSVLSLLPTVMYT